MATEGVVSSPLTRRNYSKPLNRLTIFFFKMCHNTPGKTASLKVEIEFRRLRHNKHMKVTEQDVGYVAELANLELTTEERARLVRELNSILEYVDRLNELDTSKVQPMTQMEQTYTTAKSVPGAKDFAYAGREDIVEGLRKSLPREVALANAPDTDSTFFRVPKVIER